ncbi:Transmembrane protein 11, mitochondrial [Cichlidogyrus casuarinus]|uniref:Transmembrane protein 11, mitochondrial n=1 Tax=Cichlidogyrus casuarinus TaxID=1844966 RepID=A0ABD2PVL2_9PLAT
MLEIAGDEKKTFAVIRAVYENRNSPEQFVKELDFVLSKKVSIVVIEPDSLGEETWRWIKIGNFLHKTSVVTGMVVQSISQLPAALTHRTQHSPKSTCSINGSTIASSGDPTGPPLKPVVIIRRDHFARIVVHNSVAALAVGLSGLVLFRNLKA